jgi:hypothetical protein
MNHHHRKTLHALFAHPLSANVDFKKVIHLLEDLGAEVDNKPGNRVGVMLNGRSAAFTHAHRDLPKEEVVRVRKFLSGVSACSCPLLQMIQNHSAA